MDQASKVGGFVRLNRIDRPPDAPRYEVWWLDEQSARMGVQTAEFHSLNLSREVDGQFVTDLVAKHELPFWRRGAFYWAALVGIVSLVGYTATLSEAYQWLFGSADAVLEVEAEEVLKPQGVSIPFRLSVTAHSRKRFGQIWVKSLSLAGEPKSFELKPITPIDGIAVAAGKTEKFDYRAKATQYGDATLTFTAVVQAGILHRPQTLISAPVTISIWKGRDDNPKLEFITAEFPAHPRFEVVLHSSEACRNVEIELNFTGMTVSDLEVRDPINAGSCQPGTLIQNPRSNSAQYRFNVMDTQALKEVRIPFDFTTNAPPQTPETWKETKSIVVFAQ